MFARNPDTNLLAKPRRKRRVFAFCLFDSDHVGIKDIQCVLTAVAGTVKPEAELVAKYEARYQQFKKIYPACRQLFRELNGNG